MTQLPDSESRLAERSERLKAIGPRPPWYMPFARRQWRRAFNAIMAMDVSTAAEIYARIYAAESAMPCRPVPVLSLLGKDRAP